MAAPTTISVPPHLESQVVELRAAIVDRGGREMSTAEVAVLALSEGLEKLQELLPARVPMAAGARP